MNAHKRIKRSAKQTRNEHLRQSMTSAARLAAQRAREAAWPAGKSSTPSPDFIAKGTRSTSPTPSYVPADQRPGYGPDPGERERYWATQTPTTPLLAKGGHLGALRDSPVLWAEVYSNPDPAVREAAYRAITGDDHV